MKADRVGRRVLPRAGVAASVDHDAPALGRTMRPDPADRRAKRQRLLAILEARGADSLLLTSHGAVSWYLDGVRTHVSLAGDPVVAVAVRRDADEVFVFANEADRLIDEELGAPDAALVTRVPWHAPLVTPLDGTLREIDLALELRAARASLLPAELARYRALCAEVASGLTDVALESSPRTLERAAAAALSAALVERGIDPLVVLVAGAGRERLRHPLPTAAPLGAQAMFVVCGRRNGLIANATRWVQWGAAAGGVGPSTAAALRILEVEAAFFDATRPGARLGDVFASGTAAYAAAGFDAGEWRRHHQGGAAGYVGRDPRVTADVDDLVQRNQAFAWNPSAPGTKVEDTVLVSPSGVETLTVDLRWPTVEVGGRDRPVPLRL
ncbi:M24 family metallopeptidase [Herbiconiux daphne]|uniref:Peptidase M24 n=1 Tax=Herbiconiux daphne TaxID=2970914 RepID=A0ABT2H354_9MICO|nr:peptidase M24 [Herbiconiux daphne]MCS5734337.1 peptidase M24 [Herbiconiux daphne]